jgi:hypothetical protein
MGWLGTPFRFGADSLSRFGVCFLDSFLAGIGAGFLARRTKGLLPTFRGLGDPRVVRLEPAHIICHEEGIVKGALPG